MKHDNGTNECWRNLLQQALSALEDYFKFLDVEIKYGLLQISVSGCPPWHT